MHSNQRQFHLPFSRDLHGACGDLEQLIGGRARLENEQCRLALFRHWIILGNGHDVLDLIGAV